MKIETAVQTVWAYHQLGHEMTLKKADLIWVLGSHDLRVADRAATLWKEGLAPVVLMSGGFGNFTAGVFERPEAELLAERAMKLGVPQKVILIENRSSNCGENVAFSRELLEREEMTVSSAIAVQKPYMERRTYATIRKQWPELDVQVTSPRLSLDAYCTKNISREKVIHIMVGDLQRIWEYPKLGFMIEQEVPREVREAWDLLVGEGYDQHLIT